MKRLLFFALASLFAASAAIGQHARRAFTIEDLYRVVSPSDISLSPDGRTILFTVGKSDLPHGKRTSQIWAMDADGQNLRQLTQGDSDSTPRYAPDGKHIAFLRSDNLYLLPTAGGEAKQLTSVSTGVGDPLWSPDGKWIAFSADVYPECNGDDACNKRVGDRWEKGKLKAHMADDVLLFRHWTAWRDGKVTHTFIANAETGAVRDVTPGRFDFPGFQLGGPLQYAFSPDSTELCVSSNHDPDPESSTNNDLWLIALGNATAQPRNITAANKSYDSSPQYSPDAKFIAYRTQTTPRYESALFQLALYDRQAGTSRIVSAGFNNWIDDFRWSADSKSILFTGPVEGHNPLYRLDLGSGKIAKLFDDQTIDAFEVAKNGNDLFYVHRSVGEPPEIYRADFAAGFASKRKLTHFNDTLANDVDLRPAETMWVTGADNAKIEVFIVKPHNFDPAKKYPLILNVHGGPQSQWADSFRGDWQVYQGAGYVVAFANPHGSTGYGQEFTAEISGDWGGKVFDDLMHVTDALEKLPYVDASRMGAMGWSFGGYMMDWFEGHTARFKAIASMMGIFDNRAFYGATEELWFPEWDLKGQPWNSQLYEQFSPSNSVTNFKTPCLVITGERDYRVPYTQGLEMYTSLKKMHVPSRLIVYSEAGHWPSWYEMALYYTAHLEWFQKWLGGGGPPWTTEAFLRNAVFDTSTGKRIDEKEKAPENPQGKPDVKP